MRFSRTPAFAGILLLAGCVVPAPRLVAPPPPVARPAGDRLDPSAFALSGNAVQGGLLFGTAPSGTATLLLDGKPVPFASDGHFLVGFGRDAAADALLTAQLADGSRIRAPIKVRARTWDIQSLPTLPRGTDPTPEFLARRKVELQRIEAARARRSGSEGWRQPFAWPVTGRISGVFGSQRIYAGEPGVPHSGVDVARPTGTPVAAPADGVVILAADAPFTLEGRLLMIDHGMGLNSAFLHLSRIDVAEGQKVVRGQIVGAIGATGRATGPHLHWGMKWQDVRIDPQLLTGPMQ